MKKNQLEKRWLIADIGGTNSRLAVWQADDSARGALSNIRKLRNAAYVQIDDMLGAYLDTLDGQTITGAVLAIAGPVTGEDVVLSNIDWQFNVPTLRASLKLSELVAINDFEALAYAVPVLRDDEQIMMGAGTRNPLAPAVIIGPGTGLGLASIIKAGEQYVAIPGEGGHVTMPACNAQEERIIQMMRERHGHCSAERLLSGDGLRNIHEALHGQRPSAQTISEMAHAGDADALATFDQFFLFLGSVAGDAALTLGAQGGVFLGGGILPTNQALLLKSNFRQRFIDKGRFKPYLDNIQTSLITPDTPALIGLSSLAANM